MQFHNNAFGRLVGISLAAGITVAGNASAQSSVNLSGTLDVGLSQLTTTTAAGVTSRVTSMAGGGMQTPVFGFSGVEDLGGDLRATYAFSTYFTRMNVGAAARSDADPFFSAGANLGLASSNWGALKFGRITTPTIVALFETNAWLGSTTYGSSFINNWGGVVRGDTGFSNAVRYDSPSINGFQAQLMYSLGEQRTSGPDKKYGVGYDWRLDYTSGPFRGTLAGRSIDQSVNNDGRKQTMTILGGSYDLRSFAVYGQYVKVDDRYTKSASDVDRTGWNIGVRVPVGSAVLIASTARAKIDDLNPATSARRNTTSIGADYFLSKRTDLYVAYSNDRFTNPTGTKSTRLGLGMRHKF